MLKIILPYCVQKMMVFNECQTQTAQIWKIQRMTSEKQWLVGVLAKAWLVTSQRPRNADLKMAS
jgi:hypothetical protein